MLVFLKSARDMLTNMSYKGFEIKDEKDFFKCLLSIIIDYFGSMFHDRDNQQQDTIFHHLAQGICYTLGDKLKKQKGLGRNHPNSNQEGTECETGLVRERCQSSSSCVKVSEPTIDSNGLEELGISFDLTSLSYAYSLLHSSSHVIFLDTRTMYSFSADLLCKYIYYGSSKSDEADDLTTSSSSSSSNCDDTLKCLDEDRIEIHRFPQAFDELESSLVISLPVNRSQSINSSQSLLRSLLIPGSMLNNVEINQKYCLVYLNCEKSILGRSEPFQFDTKPNHNSQINKSDDAAGDSDEDGFVIVES